MRRRQRGFLLNPYRHQGSTVGKTFSMGGEAGVSFVGSSIFAAAVNASAEAELIMDGNATAGAASMAAEAAMTMVGASVSSAVAEIAAESSMTAYGTSGAIVCDAADFDGSNDSLVRASAMTGQSDSKKGILSVWFDVDDLSGSGLSNDDLILIRDASTNIFAVSINHSTDLITISGADSSGVNVLQMTHSSSLTTGHWYHLLASWDLSSSSGQIYIDDVSDLAAGGTYTDDNLRWTSASSYKVSLGASGGFLFDGGIAEMYLAIGQNLDFSVEENRRKFRTSDGGPADLGLNGENPIGTAPLIYLHLDDGEAAANFAINRGSGGNFTVSGALGTRATSPSD